MPLSEEQKRKEQLMGFEKLKVRVKRDIPDQGFKKGEVINYHSFGSVICWAEDGRWISFYDVEII